MELRHLTSADSRRVPWKNGRGVTEELLLWPPSTSFERGDFEWRIARAGVAEDAPFSPFPGFERVLVVISGPGLRLAHGAAAPVVVPPLQPHVFSGDDPTRAGLLGGPVSDLNVLARRGVARAQVAVLRGAGAELHADHAVLHAVAALRAQVGESGVALAAGESLWIREAAAELRVTGGVGVLVQIRAAS